MQSGFRAFGFLFSISPPSKKLSILPPACALTLPAPRYALLTPSCQRAPLHAILLLHLTTLQTSSLPTLEWGQASEQADWRPRSIQIEGQKHVGGNRLKTRSRGKKPSIFKSYLWLGYFLWMRWLMWICEARHALSIDNFSSIGASDDLSTSLFIEFLTQLFYYWSIYWSGSSTFFYYIG